MGILAEYDWKSAAKRIFGDEGKDMIDMKKKYRTRDGREVRIYATDGEAPYVVHGAFKAPDGWHWATWDKDGVYHHNSGYTDPNLIEVKPSAIDQMIEWLDAKDTSGVSTYAGAAFSAALVEARRIKAESEE